MKNKREKTKLLLVRIFCIILSLLMVSSIMYYTIIFLIGG